jgi:hypothetical protein
VKKDRLLVRREGAAADANSVHELLDRVLLNRLLLRKRSRSDEQDENEQGQALIPIHGEIFLSLEIGDADDMTALHDLVILSRK